MYEKSKCGDITALCSWVKVTLLIDTLVSESHIEIHKNLVVKYSYNYGIITRSLKKGLNDMICTFLIVVLTYTLLSVFKNY